MIFGGACTDLSLLAFCIYHVLSGLSAYHMVYLQLKHDFISHTDRTTDKKINDA